MEVDCRMMDASSLFQTIIVRHMSFFCVCYTHTKEKHMTDSEKKHLVVTCHDVTRLVQVPHLISYLRCLG